MALINCPECNKEISDKVKSCPHCGYLLIEDINIKNKSTERLGRMGVWLIILGIVAVYAVFIVFCEPLITALLIGGIFFITGIIVLSLRDVSDKIQ